MKSIVLILLLSVGAHAQNLPSHEEVDTSHDIAANDPSIGPSLKLDRTEPQKQLLIRRLFQRAGEKLIPHFSKKKITYAELLRTDPAAFKLLELHSERYTPKTENGPALVNADHEFEGISDRGFGLCWGFATLVRNFNVLAFYDPSNLTGVPGNPNSPAWIDFYRTKIDQVVRGEATVFPGIKNFRELSLVPELELYLKIYTTKLWASRAVHRTSYPILKKASDSLDAAQVESLLVDLENRLARGEMPKVIFSALIASEKIMGMNTDIHAVLVYKVERLPHRAAKIHIWDINFYAETLVREPKFIEVTPQRGLIYAPWFEPTKTYAKGSDLVARVSLAPENDAEIVDQVIALKKFCGKPQNAKYCQTALF